MRGVRRRQFALAAAILIMMFCGGGAFAENLGPVRALFSADDALCGSLAAVYDRLLRERGPGRHMVLDWERTYPSWFKDSGLERPARVNNLPAPDFDFGEGVRVFYRADLMGDGHPRLVYMDDNCVGRCDEFSTTIWILKPNEKSKLVERSWPDAGGHVNTWNLFDPAVIESRIGLGLRPPKPPTSSPTDAEPIYPETYGRFFDRSLDHFVDQAEWSRVITGKEATDDATRRRWGQNRYVDIVGGSGPFIQQIWLHNGQALFTARSYLADVMVYRYTSANSIDTVCLLSPVK
jgi:hypothetical protein